MSVHRFFSIPHLPTEHDTSFEECERALRSMVRKIGTVLGKIIKEQAGYGVFSAVETLREGFIQLRQGNSDGTREELIATIRQLPPATLTQVIRACWIHLTIISLLEELHHYSYREQHAWRVSFAKTLLELSEQHVTAAELSQLLRELSYTQVITFGLTELIRGTVQDALRRIFLTLRQLESSALSGEEHGALEATLEHQLRMLWLTDEVPSPELRVYDGINDTLRVFQDNLVEAVPEFYRATEREVGAHYGQGRVVIPCFLHFGSCIGDDGNLNLTAATTELALWLHHRAILIIYLERIDRLEKLLTHSHWFCDPCAALQASLERDSRDLPGLAAEFAHPHPHEPYRNKLLYIRARIERRLAVAQAILRRQNRPEAGGGYRSAEQLLTDLHLIRDSLAAHGDEISAEGELKDLIRLVETFGFYLASSNLRQDAATHTHAVAELLAATGYSGYETLSESERRRMLTALIERGLPRQRQLELGAATAETLAVFEVMARMRHEISPEAIGRYIVAKVRRASHVLEVALLARYAGLITRDQGQWRCDISITPLFESIEELRCCDEILATLINLPTYRVLLRVAGNRQELMLGNSEAEKGGGILASSWALHEAQKRLSAVALRYAVELQFFHGHAGTVSRRGEPASRTHLSPPSHSHGTCMRITDLGEVSAVNYSQPETATHELTAGASAAIKSSISRLRGLPNELGDHQDIMAELVRTSEATYRNLVEDTAGFSDFFYETTPITELLHLRSGSRPFHRPTCARNEASLSATPWGFAWSQTRYNLSRWYGLGTALRKWCHGIPERLGQLQRLYREWPFFQDLLDNVQIALGQTDLGIAGQYAKLDPDHLRGRRIHSLITEEYERCLQQVLAVVGHRYLLGDDPSLSRSMARRNPYLEPLNFIQIELLRRCRTHTDGDQQRCLDPLQRSINAISAGLRITSSCAPDAAPGRR